MTTFNKEEIKTLTQQGITVLDFYAKWCEPCKLLTPIFDDIKEELKDSANFIKIDIDSNLELAREYRVSSVPTILIIKEGEIVDSTVGFLPKEVLKNKIDKQIN